MSKVKKITILGSGTSTGIPMVGCHCPVCTSEDLRDKRLRSSILLTTSDEKKILVDTSPDLRQQCFSLKIESLDAVIITHEHADHTHGIDELRPLTFIRNAKNLPPLPLFTSKDCAQTLKNKFSYIFDSHYHGSKKILGGGIPLLSLNEINLTAQKTKEESEVAGLQLNFFLCPHGYGESMSFYSDDFAYIVDCHSIPDSVVEILKNKKLKLLMIDCLQRNTQHTHLTMKQSFDYIKEISAEESVLFHMNHDLSHQFLEEQILKDFKNSPLKVIVAKDNLILDL